ncbi:cyclin-like protein interacting with Pho85 [Malassezia pachydermatis]
MPASELSTSPSSESSIRSKPAHLDIANFPTADLLRMLAALLQHIATSNDQIRPLNQQSMEERVHHPRDPNAIPSSMYLPLNDPQRPTTTTAALATLNSPSSTLCFHARHIPSISIEAYLLRILKYCPTTNDVFLSLLVYFDRLSRVGAVGNFPGEPPLGTYADEDSSTKSLRDSSTSPISMPWPRADVESDISKSSPDNNFPGISGFAIDSYNVHRLIIAGITVASKFFSDVFYTNARYAKVGGLAVHELNQLELHFLLLTDFRLMIPISEIQQYGDQLLAYAHDRSFSSNIQRPLPGSTEEKTQHEVHE